MSTEERTFFARLRKLSSGFSLGLTIPTREAKALELQAGETVKVILKRVVVEAV